MNRLEYYTMIQRAFTKALKRIEALEDEVFERHGATWDEIGKISGAADEFRWMEQGFSLWRLDEFGLWMGWQKGPATGPIEWR